MYALLLCRDSSSGGGLAAAAATGSSRKSLACGVPLEFDALLSSQNTCVCWVQCGPHKCVLFLYSNGVWYTQASCDVRLAAKKTNISRNFVFLGIKSTSRGLVKGTAVCRTLFLKSHGWLSHQHDTKWLPSSAFPPYPRQNKYFGNRKDAHLANSTSRPNPLRYWWSTKRCPLQKRYKFFLFIQDKGGGKSLLKAAPGGKPFYGVIVQNAYNTCNQRKISLRAGRSVDKLSCMDRMIGGTW